MKFLHKMGHYFRSGWALALCLLCLMLPLPSGFAAGPENVLVLVNDNWPDEDGNGQSDSVDVGQYYAARRGVPSEQIVHFSPNTFTKLAFVDYANFVNTIVNPLVTKLEENDGELHDRILYFVCAYGMPYRVLTGFTSAQNPFGSAVNNDARSVDSYLCALYLVHQFGPDSPVNTYSYSNLYCYHYGSNQGKSFEQRRAEMPSFFEDYYLATRIDGPTAQVAREQVDRALYGETYLHDPLHPTQTEAAGYYSGRSYWDRETPGDGTAGVDGKIHQARLDSDADGWTTIIEDMDSREFGEDGYMPAPIGSYPLTDVLWYYGWYSCGYYKDVYRWKPGAVGIHLDSCSAGNIRENNYWVVGALRKGITATAGAVNEPFATPYTQADAFFEHWYAGMNFADSAYYATHTDRWMMVMVGDPLYRANAPSKSVPRDEQPPSLTQAGTFVDSASPLTERSVFAQSDELCLIQVHYGQGGSLDQQTDWNELYTRETNFPLQGLSEGQTYDYRILLEDPSGNQTLSATDSFTMSSSSDIVAPTLSAIVTIAISATTAEIQFETNEPGTTQVDYGQSLPYDEQTLRDPLLVTLHQQTLYTLAPQTGYHFRVRSRDALGNESLSGDFSFTTEPVSATENWKYY